MKQESLEMFLAIPMFESKLSSNVLNIQLMRTNCIPGITRIQNVYNMWR